MLRKLVLLLLLGNLILWAWSHGALTGFGWAAPGAGEPQRLREQVHASNLALLGPDGQPLTASVPAGPAAPASPPASSAASSPGSSPASSPASSASAASSAASSPAS
ncbi:MAG: SPOR domain-containing protein, partial [Betaproteobacteria bacterium]|nr:SPOR domain-containing protein [Betaproteobacteria bacterium]